MNEAKLQEFENAYETREERDEKRSAGRSCREKRDRARGWNDMKRKKERKITVGSDRVVEINVARLIGATEECLCGQSGAQPQDQHNPRGKSTGSIHQVAQKRQRTCCQFSWTLLSL